MSEQSSHRREYVVNVVWFDVCSIVAGCAYKRIVMVVNCSHKSNCFKMHTIQICPSYYPPIFLLC